MGNLEIVLRQRQSQQSNETDESRDERKWRSMRMLATFAKQCYIKLNLEFEKLSIASDRIEKTWNDSDEYCAVAYIGIQNISEDIANRIGSVVDEHSMGDWGWHETAVVHL